MWKYLKLILFSPVIQTYRSCLFYKNWNHSNCLPQEVNSRRIDTKTHERLQLDLIASRCIVWYVGRNGARRDWLSMSRPCLWWHETVICATTSNSDQKYFNFFRLLVSNIAVASIVTTVHLIIHVNTVSENKRKNKLKKLSSK